MIVAIDGTVASGKSTVAHMLAARTGFSYINTGLMYRAVAAYARAHDIPTHDVATLAAHIDQLKIELKDTPEGQRVYVNGNDVTADATAPDIGAYVSDVADNEKVRAALVRAQQRMGRAAQHAVLEGRDIGSVVFPDADIKFFVTADVEERARRRFQDDKKKNPALSFDDVIRAVKERDQRDQKRPVGALIQMPDAHVIDTTHHTPQQVVDTMIALLPTTP